jgi:hypothetical protein
MSDGTHRELEERPLVEECEEKAGDTSRSGLVSIGLKSVNETFSSFDDPRSELGFAKLEILKLERELNAANTELALRDGDFYGRLAAKATMERDGWRECAEKMVRMIANDQPSQFVIAEFNKLKGDK